MVDRLEIIPGDVRGGGNITIPKNFSEDKNTNVYSTFLSENQAEIDGRWMPTFHSYYSNWYQLTVDSDAPRIVSPGGDASFNVTVSNPARENVNGVHVEVSLRSKDGENEYWASSFVIMDNQPTFSLWVPEDCDKYCEWFIHATQGGYNGVGLHRSVIVADVTDISLDVFGDKQIIQTGETCNVIGLLTGKLGESVIGIPGQTVNFYEQWTPGLRVSATPGIIQSGDESSIKAQLIDTRDGSLVREEGHTVNFYWDDAPVPVPTRLYVDFDKTILSYADGDSAYVIVRVYDQLGNAMPNQSVSVRRSDGVSWTVETDMHGQGSFSYVSQGIGDVSFTFECMNVSEIYSITDYEVYSPVEVSVTVYQQRILDNFSMLNNRDWEFSCQLKSNKGYITLCPSNNGIEDGQGNIRYIGIGANSSNLKLSALGYTTDIEGSIWHTNGSWSTSTFHNVKIVREGNTYGFYIDNVLHKSTSSTGFGAYTPLYLFIINNTDGNSAIKDIRIKPL